MRLVFMGSPDFAVPSLRALRQAGHDLAAVYCQPPRPAGRGHAERRCPVHAAAEALRLPVRTPVRLRNDPAAQRAFADLNADAVVVAAYGLILPQPMLDAPRRFCLDIHASLLPRWRGASPIQAAILAGDTETGVTIMRMEAGLDTGPMLLREAVPITSTSTAATLHDQLAGLGARLILTALERNPPAVPQPEAGATYAPKLTRDDGRIDWSHSAVDIHRQVRAFDPWPGTFTRVGNHTLKVLAVRIEPESTEAEARAIAAARGPIRPGQVLDDQLLVACGTGAVRLTRVQAPGRAALDAAAFLRGHRIPAGTLLGGA